METTEEDGQIEPLSPEDSSPSHQEMMMMMMMPRKKKGKNNKRRFSDEQVRSLETIFESETKLDPRKKVQVARELGLQPRQVAIWFQNKRARWKSKQIEKNYRVLKASFDSLKVQYDSMKKEKDSLLLQMQELRSLVDENQQKRFKGEDVELVTENREEDQVVEGAAFATEPASGFKEELVVDYQGALTSDDDRSGNLAYVAASEDQPELLSVNQHIESSFIPPAKWCSFDSGGCLYDQSLNSSQWWESLT